MTDDRIRDYIVQLRDHLISGRIGKAKDTLRKMDAELSNPQFTEPKYYDPDERNTFGFPTGR